MSETLCSSVHFSTLHLSSILSPSISGTIFSGLFCLCIGVPRFSLHDSARARFGSFVINIIVGVAQAFTLIFCLVGWGWSVWWGMILLRTASEYIHTNKCILLLQHITTRTDAFFHNTEQQRRIKMAENADLAEENTIGSGTTSLPRDIEAVRR